MKANVCYATENVARNEYVLCVCCRVSPMYSIIGGAELNLLMMIEVMPCTVRRPRSKVPDGEPLELYHP